MPRSKRRADGAGVGSATVATASIGTSSRSNVSNDRDVAETEGQMITPLLPMEVVSLILENLRPLDQENCQGLLPNIEEGFRNVLQTLALVSSVWCCAARATLFYAIWINDRKTCQFWSRKFKHSPHLGEYVRSLHLSDPGDDCHGTPYLRTLPAKILISTLTRLQSLSIQGIIRWGPVEQRLIKGLQSVANLEVGRIVCMKGCRDIPDLFYALPNVDRLCLTTVGHDESDLASIYKACAVPGKRVPEDGKRRQLRALQLSQAHLGMEYLTWLTGPSFDLSRLADLSLTWQEFPSSVEKDKLDFSSHNKFFRLAGRHIATLELFVPSPSNQAELAESRIIVLSNPQDYLTGHLISSRILHYFTNLSTISIYVKETDNLLPFLISTAGCLLETLATSHSSLHRIKLTVGLNARDWGQQGGSLRPEAPGCWRTLDELLSGNAFPELSTVDLVIHARGLGQEYTMRYGQTRILVVHPNREELCGLVQACLPRTASKNVLNLKIHDVKGTGLLYRS